ncbi:MAG: acyl-CoA dehydrogenase family protein [Acidobacteriota bacterium]|jgi:alkylation response protein AidB-like acyl-CoA dehydrogenase
MPTAGPQEVSEQESREVAEDSREQSWTEPSLLRELFLGRFRLDLVHPFPLPGPARSEFTEFYRRFEAFLHREVDAGELDRSGEYPPHVLEGLRRLGAFGMKIPKEYGGLGFTNAEYNRVMALVGGHCGNIAALLSAHQSIGVPQPLKLFGSERLKQKYLPRCAAGEISAFALTEPDVGSDPARLATTATRAADGSAYTIDGTKLWTTNGGLAKLLVVMARDPETRKISAFVVETDWPGVRVVHRCHFMGLRAISNVVLSLDEVRVPAENLIGTEGKGLKIALTTLNDGRLSIPNISVGGAKAALGIVRRWSAERVQWGKPIGRHEAIAHKIADIGAQTFAMESVVGLVTEMSDRGGADTRLEAAAAKEWVTFQSWRIVDETMQIRGGRGYETEHSLAGRGEEPIPVERMMRDARISKIFEGSTEIMHLFMAREMVDKHLEVAGALVDSRTPLSARLAALPGIAAFYAWWYPTRWVGWSFWPRYSGFGALATHLRFVERSSRKLARSSFHGMFAYRADLQNKQAFLFRLVDIANELFAMAASVTRARALADAEAAEAKEAARIADVFCRGARRRVRDLFRDLWRNDDVPRYRLGVEVVDGRHEWLEAGGAPAAETRSPEPRTEPAGVP